MVAPKKPATEETALQSAVVAGELVPSDTQRPDFIEAGREGTEHITNADMQIPRIVIAQKMSPEVDDSDAKRIPDLKPGDMFNGLTKELYGRGPLHFVILRADPPRGVEFIPRDQGGGVLDPNVPLSDPRMQFGPRGEKPVATKFYDYVILLMPFGDDPLSKLLALSFKSTGLKIAKQLNSLIKLRNAAVYAGIYSLTSVDTQNAKGKFAIPQVVNAGWVRDRETYAQLSVMAEALKNKVIDIPREPGDDYDEEFPPATDTTQPAGVAGM